MAHRRSRNQREAMETMEWLHEELQNSFRRCLDVFRDFDGNGDGTLTAGEFAKGLAELGVHCSVPVARELFALLDADADGTVEYTELLRGLRDEREGRVDGGGASGQPHSPRCRLDRPLIPRYSCRCLR